MPAGIVRRAKIILYSADGLPNAEIAGRLDVSPFTVGTWRKRFLAHRIEGLHDELRPGRPHSLGDEEIAELINKALQTEPSNATHWSVRSFAREAKVTTSMTFRLFKLFALQPHRTESFKLSTDPFFVEVEQRLRVAELAGCKITNKKMVLSLPDDSESAVSDFLKKSRVKDTEKVIGFQVGASTASRMWFPEQFIELGRKLVSAYPDLKIIVTGSPQERDYAEKITNGIGERAIVSSGAIPLKYMPLLLLRFRALVTGDTGIMHMAIAVGTPVVALFSVADPKRSGPYYDMGKHVTIKKERTCDPCVSKKCKDQKCMRQITVSEVFDAVRQPLLR